MKKGATLLVIMIIIAAMICTLAVSIALRGITENQITLYHSQSSEMSAHLNACADEALVRINRNNLYTGETLSIGTTQCTITVTGSGKTRNIDVNATEPDYNKRVQISITIFPEETITSWKESI